MTEDIYTSLESAGFEVNPTVKASYEEWLSGGKITGDASISALDTYSDTLAGYGAFRTNAVDGADGVVNSRRRRTVTDREDILPSFRNRRFTERVSIWRSAL